MFRIAPGFCHGPGIPGWNYSDLLYIFTSVLNQAMKNIFVYGSLMYEDVWTRIVHRHYQKQAAILPGFRRLVVKGESYPGLVRSYASAVEGIVYFDVSAQDVRRLDKFEGQYYKKISVKVRTMDGRVHTASVYVFGRRYRRLLGATSWDPIRFRTKYLSRFISRYQGF